MVTQGEGVGDLARVVDAVQRHVEAAGRPGEQGGVDGRLQRLRVGQRQALPGAAGERPYWSRLTTSVWEK